MEPVQQRGCAGHAETSAGIPPGSRVVGTVVASSWTGKYPGGIPLSSSTNTFLSIRPWYIGDPQWSKVQTYLNGGSAPTFKYHRFWAEPDIATAFDTFANLFPAVKPAAS